MKLIQDLGRIYPTPNSRQKKHYAIVECPVCGKRARAIIPRALKPDMCVACFREQKTLPPINVDGFHMKLIQDLGKQYPTSTSKQKTRYGVFECKQCKTQSKYAVNDIKRSATGGLCKKCYKPIAAANNSTHGDSQTTNSIYKSLYRRWSHIKARCNCVTDDAYPRYGGVGITMIKSWEEDYSVFKEWAISNGYQEQLTIDREDNSKGYSPDNCRWVSYEIQNRNRGKIKVRQCSSKYKGVTLKNNRYAARIMVNRVSINLDNFDSQIDAAKAYNNYIIEHNLEHTLNDIG